MEAIDKTAAAGGKVIEFYPGQKFSPDQPDVKFDHNATDEMIAAVKARLEEGRHPRGQLRRGGHSQGRGRRAEDF